ncbi:hypothetical protein DPMN_090096 [Dreissena polymorpha]|uniref:Secreted protein n=1 Tax=Dreissena polymorpha TaxID=45954 RepID=A0A9D4KXL7_DREPO|nr:hypothetical protein DPMN_090096 [Dreissena polymorpha]
MWIKWSAVAFLLQGWKSLAGPMVQSSATFPLVLSLSVDSGTPYIRAALYTEVPDKVAWKALCKLSLS